MREKPLPPTSATAQGSQGTPVASLPLRVSALSTRRANHFHLRPDAPAREGIAADLDLLALRKLDFRGMIEAAGRDDWRLEGQLGATVVQACVISAEPVTTRLDLPVTRLFSAEPAAASGAETEMPEDDRIDPLGTEIDPGAVMIEALALALPDYPRKEGATLGARGALAVLPTGAVTEPATVPGIDPPDATPGDGSIGAAPGDGRKNPFAALAPLRDVLAEKAQDKIQGNAQDKATPAPQGRVPGTTGRTRAKNDKKP
ncbi:MAG: YceD family protein [Pararhodobacter sp.]